ncbi:arsenate reductase (glutaredoxin) [Urechidicola vernalis]|uniref:Arsenate reductase (Glutaredoxin) n=1 Tax=Urechidicola vernalis TaxID=3075600 RepID=A0ABU2Y390_9FLAO|nr:arsenate reductase (glutaredoxin) [Urechidicola sp. P050]MDT0551710.1 arsenate reductase (glutaredoxin) [Urechidicola sp. P050]
MIQIYHNPRCSKSRQGLQILEALNLDFEVVKYLDAPPTEKELAHIIKLLKITPMQLVRKGETLWKENYKGKDLSDKELIKALSEHPKLIERPIVIANGKAVIGRPPAQIKELF